MTARAIGQQLDLFSADPDPLIDLLRVLVSTRAAQPACGCTCRYLRQISMHVGLYCAGHGRWICWLDRAGKERARQALEVQHEHGC